MMDWGTLDQFSLLARSLCIGAGGAHPYRARIADISRSVETCEFSKGVASRASGPVAVQRASRCRYRKQKGIRKMGEVGMQANATEQVSAVDVSAHDNTDGGNAA